MTTRPTTSTRPPNMPPPRPTRPRPRRQGLPLFFLLWLLLVAGSVLVAFTYMYTTLHLTTGPPPLAPPRRPLDAAALELVAYDTRRPATSAFLEAMKAYPWQALEEAIAQEDHALVDKYAQEMLYRLTPFLVQPSIDDDRSSKKIKKALAAAAAASAASSSAPEPQSLASSLVSWAVSSLAAALPSSSSSSSSCPDAPPLPDPIKLDCAAHPEAFSGELRATPAKIAHVLQFAFDADTLEILLHELNGVVDRVFLLESTKTHNKALGKPLLWDDLKRQARFAPFLDMVVHMVLGA